VEPLQDKEGRHAVVFAAGEHGEERRQEQKVTTNYSIKHQPSALRVQRTPLQIQSDCAILDDHLLTTC